MRGKNQRGICARPVGDRPGDGCAIEPCSERSWDAHRGGGKIRHRQNVFNVLTQVDQRGRSRRANQRYTNDEDEAIAFDSRFHWYKAITSSASGATKKVTSVPE